MALNSSKPTVDQEAAKKAAEEAELARLAQEEEAAKKAASQGAKAARFRATKGTLVDPFTLAGYHVTRDTEAAEPKTGSWLDCQIKAGLIIKVG